MPQHFPDSFIVSRSPDTQTIWVPSHHHIDPSVLVPAYCDGTSYQVYYHHPIPNQSMQGYYDPHSHSHFSSAHLQFQSTNKAFGSASRHHSHNINERKDKFYNKYRSPKKNVTNATLLKKSISENVKSPLHEWRTKTPSPRYESDDSGIAESPSSVASSSILHHYDEVKECKSSDQNLKILETGTEDVQTLRMENSFNQNSTETVNLSNEEETFWSIADDENFWQRLHQKPPSNHVINRIVDQVEYYLSDEYLLKDRYLLRQIRCKKDGYVSIKLVTSFKKVKKLTKNWAVVRSAIVRRSKNLVVSSEGLRIKRKIELSETLRKPRLLTSILVIRLPEEYNAVNRVTSLFSGFGEIEYVRLLRADKNIPADLRNYATQVPDLGRNLCAVVDFESAENALDAVRTMKYFQKLTGEDELQKKDEKNECVSKYVDILAGLPPLGDMRLALLGPRVRRTLYRQDRVGESGEDEDSIASSGSHDDAIPIPDVSANFKNKNNAPEISKSRRPVFLLKQHLSANKIIAVRQPKGPESEKGFNRKRRLLKL